VPDWVCSAPRLADRDGVPAHVKIERWLTGVIAQGALVPGDRLPREAELAAMIGVSRMTLRQALSTLESLGTVVRTTGRTGGTFVTEPRIECDLTGLAGFTEQLRRAHLRAGARMVSATTLAAPAAVARALMVRRGAPVHAVSRVRTAQRRPLVLERSYFPVELFPDLLEQRLTGSLYSLLTRHYQQKPYLATENLEPVIARDEEAKLLEIEPGSALMLIERTAYTAAGQAVEYARDLFRPDRVRVSLRTGIGKAREVADLGVGRSGQGSERNAGKSGGLLPPGVLPGSAGTRPGSAGTRPGSAGTRPGSAGTRPGSAGTRPGSAERGEERWGDG